MIKSNNSKISHKDSIHSYASHHRGRSSSAKSNPHSAHKKVHQNYHSNNTKTYQKVLTQTTSSKIRRSTPQSPLKSTPNKKDKMHHMLSDKISTKSMRKGRIGK